MRFGLRLAIAAMLPSLSITHASVTPIGAIEHVVVVEDAIGPEAEGCARFSVTPGQVEAFFRRAVVLSGRQHHDYFQHGPCSARGTLGSRYDTWQWEIRSLGTGSLTASNGDRFQFGDPGAETSPEGP